MTKPCDRVSWLIVTPARNEVQNLPHLSESLARQRWLPSDALWVIVDDGSTDGSDRLVADLKPRINLRWVSRPDGGAGLAAGSAFSAWRHGVEVVLSELSTPPERVMKLDADVILPPAYFQRIANALADDPSLGLVGGVVRTQGSREQAHHVPGALKHYSVAAYEALRELPAAVGFDVMDEVVLRHKGFRMLVLAHAAVEVRRRTGSSEGLIRGRRRNGRMVRWTGYDRVYACLHVLRYLFRRPAIVGALAMALGIVESGRGPYPPKYKLAHAKEQRAKLRQLMSDPIEWLERTYR